MASFHNHYEAFQRSRSVWDEGLRVAWSQKPQLHALHLARCRHTPARSTSSISSQACTFSGHDQQGQQQAVCARPGCSCCRRGQCSASSSEHAASSASHSSTPSTSLLSPLITSARLTGGCSSPAALHPSLTSSTAHVSTASSLGHTRAYHSHRPTRVRHAGWFRSSCSKDAAIRQLASVEDIRAYWDYEGGSPSSGRWAVAWAISVCLGVINLQSRHAACNQPMLLVCLGPPQPEPWLLTALPAVAPQHRHPAVTAGGSCHSRTARHSAAGI